MKRNTLNFILDSLLAVAALGMVATGLLIRWVLPPGSGEWRTVWGLGRHDWGDVHFWLAISIVVVLLIHLAMHWQWACTTAMRFIRRSAEGALPRALWRNVTGIALVGLVAAGLAGFVAVAAASVEETGARGMGHDAHHSQVEGDASPFLQGSMTLSEAAKAYGITEKEVCDRLGMSGNLSGDKRMGPLMRNRGMTMAEAREKLQTKR